MKLTIPSASPQNQVARRRSTCDWVSTEQWDHETSTLGIGTCSAHRKHVEQWRKEVKFQSFSSKRTWIPSANRASLASLTRIWTGGMAGGGHLSPANNWHVWRPSAQKGAPTKRVWTMGRWLIVTVPSPETMLLVRPRAPWWGIQGDRLRFIHR